MLTKLEKLLIGEVSGVDDPANETPGWLVMKAASAASSSADASATANAADAAPTLKDRLALLFGKEDDGMTEDALKAILDEREDALVEKLAVKLAPTAPEAPAAPAVEATALTEKASAPEAPAPAAPAPEAAPAALDAEAIEKAAVAKVEAILEPLVKALDAVIDRLAAVEARFATRQSIPAQDPAAGEEGVAKTTNTVGSAIEAAFRR